MKYKILTKENNRWGEGWKFCDIVCIDKEAAKIPLENGEIEMVGDKPEIKQEVEFKCDCGKICKSKIGLISHQRACKKNDTKNK